MQIEITQNDLKDAITPLTRATTDDWGQAFKRVAKYVGVLYAFAFAVGSYVRYIVRRPGEALSSVTRPAAVETQPLKVEEPVVVTAPVRKTRSRKRSAKGAAHTTPAGFAS